MISESGMDWPMGSMAFTRHWAHRPELVMLPSFSTDETQGRKKTSVWTSLGSIPGPRQKEPVSLSKRFTFTIHLSLASAFRTLPAFEPEQAGFWPQAKNPSYLPFSMLSKRLSHERFMPSSSFGIQA